MLPAWWSPRRGQCPRRSSAHTGSGLKAAVKRNDHDQREHRKGHVSNRKRRAHVLGEQASEQRAEALSPHQPATAMPNARPRTSLGHVATNTRLAVSMIALVTPASYPERSDHLGTRIRGCHGEQERCQQGHRQHQRLGCPQGEGHGRASMPPTTPPKGTAAASRPAVRAPRPWPGVRHRHRVGRDARERTISQVVRTNQRSLGSRKTTTAPARTSANSQLSFPRNAAGRWRTRELHQQRRYKANVAASHDRAVLHACQGDNQATERRARPRSRAG